MPPKRARSEEGPDKNQGKPAAAATGAACAEHKDQKASTSASVTSKDHKEAFAASDVKEAFAASDVKEAFAASDVKEPASKRSKSEELIINNPGTCETIKWGTCEAHIFSHVEVDGQTSHFIHIPGGLRDYKHQEEFRAFVNTLVFPSKRAKFAKHDFPRDMLWFAENGEAYTFSGKTFESGVWNAQSHIGRLADFLNTSTNQLKERLKEATSFLPAEVKAALINRYKNGLDSINAHSDKESCLGVNPTVISLSLGATRIMKVTRKSKAVFNKDRKWHHLPGSVQVPTRSRETYQFQLESGDLFIFAGAAQVFWEHRIDKEPELVKQKMANKMFVPPPAERVNFTFRPHY
jgi:alkylated DNA repair dioxygenase AlkB